MPTFNKITNEVARDAAKSQYRRLIADIEECEELMNLAQLDMTLSDEEVIESNAYYSGAIADYREELASLLGWA